ncbi:TPA: hypothetical protein ACGZ84_004168 [Vibrio parahaemolyticus]
MDWIKDRALLICVSIVAALVSYLFWFLLGENAFVVFPVLVLAIYLIEYLSKKRS